MHMYFCHFGRFLMLFDYCVCVCIVGSPLPHTESKIKPKSTGTNEMKKTLAYGIIFRGFLSDNGLLLCCSDISIQQ